MENITSVAKMLITFGLLMILGGGILLLFGRITPFGRLPGDVFIQRGNFVFFFPIVTCLLVSLLLTLLFNVFFRK